MAGNGEQKFISIYKAYVDEIYQYIFLRTGYDVSLAEDLTQDILDLCQYFGQKKLKAYAAFFNSSSSFC